MDVKDILTAYNKARAVNARGPGAVPYTVLECEVLAAVQSACVDKGIDGFAYEDVEFRGNFITCYYGDIPLRFDMSTVYREKTDQEHYVEIDFHNGEPADYCMVAQLKVMPDGTVLPHETGWTLVNLACPKQGGK
jgi:hypothetical protein